MRTEEEIRIAIAQMGSDVRLTYEPALIEINGPLALIQVSLKERVRALRWVLSEIPAVVD